MAAKTTNDTGAGAGASASTTTDTTTTDTVAVSDTRIVVALCTVGLAGGKMKKPGDNFELATADADELEEAGIVQGLEAYEAEQAAKAKTAKKK